MNVLVVVDMQKDFIDGSLGTAEALAIVPTVKELIDNFDGIVIFTQDTHDENYLNTSEGQHLPIIHCVKSTDGWDIESSLYGDKPVVLLESDAQYDALTSDVYYRIEKGQFGSPELANGLKYIESKIESIHLCGICTDICVVSNALLLKASLPETPIIVHELACAGVTPEKHNSALEVMRSCQMEMR